MASTIDGVRPQVDRDFQPRTLSDNPEIIEALKHGNIHEVIRKLPSNVSMREIEDYLASQSKTFQGSIVQGDEIFTHTLLPEPKPEDFKHIASVGTYTMTPQERQDFNQSFDRHFSRGHGGAKASTIAAIESAPNDIFSTAQGALDDWGSFYSKFSDQMFQTQMVTQQKKVHEEMKDKINEIISKVKQGLIEPEYIMLAITKSYMSENGIAFVMQGKKMMTINEEMNQISKDLYKKGGTSMDTMKETELAQAKLRDLGSNMQQLQFGIQQSAQNISSQFEQASSLMKQMDQARLNIRMNVGKN